MKVGNDTLLTILVSLSMATVSGAGTLIWWVAGLQSRVKSNEKDVMELKENGHKKNDSIVELDKEFAVMKNDLKNIYIILQEIKSKLK